MTSVFYDVIYLAAIRGGTNAPRVGHFDSFLRKFEPQNVVGHRVDPQKALTLTYVTACVLSQYALKSIRDILQ